jgi:hypothetical protein
VLPVVYANAIGDGVVEAGASPTSASAAASASASRGAAAMIAEAMQGGYVAASPGPGRARTGAPGAPGAPRFDRSTSRDLVAPDSGRDAGRDSADFSHAAAGSGLAGLSARAGETLGSYVTPVVAPSAPQGAVSRAPTAAPEYVRTGGRYGGGDVEIPPWFEAAARKMLAEKSGDGITLAELTLVTAAPPSHVAAAAIAPPSPSPTGPTGAASPGQQANAPQIDVEKLAQDLYRDILVQMDIARVRNGDSFL